MNIISENNFPTKLNLFYNIFRQLPIEINNNNYISKLVSNYQDILKILKNDDQIIKILYFNKDNIHNILYKSDEIIKIKNAEKLSFSELFYLTLLIMDNDEIINYSYTINDLYEINIFQRNISDNSILKKIITSKIIIKLIKNHRESEEYKNYNESPLESIEKENKNIISNNIYKFENLFDLNKKDNLEEIYIKILNYLNKFTKKEFNEKVYNEIINELELESIDITKNMFDSLYNILNIESENIKNLLIINQYDLIDNKKVSFYYILFKYIFKNQIYIYQIPLLLKIRKNIIIMINNKFNQLSIHVKENIRQKMEYIIKIITDSEYYYKKYLEFNEQPFIEVFNYYKNYFFESKIEDIKILEKIIKNKKIISDKNYLEDLDIAKKMNEKFPVIEYLFNIGIKNDNSQKTETEMKRFLIKWESIEKMIIQQKFKKMIKSYKIALINYFKEENNKKILLKIFDEYKFNNFINESQKFLDKNSFIYDNKLINIKIKIEEPKSNKN